MSVSTTTTETRIERAGKADIVYRSSLTGGASICGCPAKRKDAVEWAENILRLESHPTIDLLRERRRDPYITTDVVLHPHVMWEVWSGEGDLLAEAATEREAIIAAMP